MDKVSRAVCKSQSLQLGKVIWSLQSRLLGYPGAVVLSSMRREKSLQRHVEGLASRACFIELKSRSPTMSLSFLLCHDVETELLARTYRRNAYRNLR